MSIYSYIKKDHEEMKDLLRRIEALGPEETAERNELFNTLKDKCILHSKAEEQAFYKPLRKFDGLQEEVEHGKEEHEEAEDLLEELTNPSLAGTAWMQKFKHLKDELEHHMDEEEEDIFPDAKKVLSDEMAAKMEDVMKGQKQEEKADRDIDHRHA